MKRIDYNVTREISGSAEELLSWIIETSKKAHEDLTSNVNFKKFLLLSELDGAFCFRGQYKEMPYLIWIIVNIQTITNFVTFRALAEVKEEK